MFKLIKKMKRREALLAVGAIFVVVINSYFELKLPDYMSALTVLITAGGEHVMGAIGRIAVEMLLCVLASVALTVLSGYLSARAAAGFTYGVREELFDHILSLDQAQVLGFSVPSLITRSTNDVVQIQMLLSMGMSMIVKAPTMAIIALVKILTRSIPLSMLTLGVVAVLVCGQIFIMSRVIPRIRKVQKLTDKINQVARENITGINVVHAFNAEQYQNDKFDGPNSEMMGLQLKNQKLFAAMMPGMGLAMNGLSLAIYWIGAVLLNQLPDFPARLEYFSNLVVFSSYATHVVMSFSMLVMIFMMIPQGQVSAERINAVFAACSAIREGKKKEDGGELSLEFQDVSFTYPDAAQEDLSHISFRVEKGETLAIIGSTGCGKTTLVNLIPRFYDATSGSVRIDGVDVREYDFETLYNKLGYVPQKAVLFSGTVRDNIAFGKKEQAFTEEDLNFAVETAQAAEFVNKQEKKLEHVLAQAGKNVSGGQKQRLSIARALARKPEILIFDDSFSALDYRTDANLRSALSKSCRDSIKVIVAQRIGTIRHADKILVLEEGRMAGLGTHEELMKNCDVYREIAASQLSAAELA